MLLPVIHLREFYPTEVLFLNHQTQQDLPYFSYDFYLPIYNLLIEYQSIQHEHYIPGLHKSIKDFEIQQEHDRRKREYANKNNIKLLEIWYYDFDRINEILTPIIMIKN
jgi:hypothetical protein